jgi:uncharacterized membrane protein YoaK (UPF0700 family)
MVARSSAEAGHPAEAAGRPAIARYRVLPPSLLTLTVATGVVDAVSYLVLGHVFVANMTGNVVLLGFALAGTGGLSALTSLTSIGSFLIGAAIGGRVAARHGGHPGRHLTVGAAVTAVAAAGALALAAAAGWSAAPAHYGLIALLALGMGVQSATARRLGVADLTTNVLTMTLTGLASDSPHAGATLRRVGSVLCMLAGALLGGLLIRGVSVTAALGLATVLLAVTAATVGRLAVRTPAQLWQRPSTSPPPPGPR